MSDFVQPTTIKPTIHRALLTPLNNSSLPLSGQGPFSVNVQVDASGNASFSQSSSATTYSSIQWTTPPNAQPATITFTFVAGTSPNPNTPIGLCTDAISDLAFGCVSPLPPSTPTQQICACQPQQLQQQYSFRVYYKNTSTGATNTTGDPIIIVTPPS
ncbi:MAG: hypothetical protein E6J90_36190 [Deltaproteobacteria bacterium]|nr:MAG: hypothetical protein E6J90_36190 [Deltaproteobacteria bacterium]TMQ14504.1 MAG: hypothetical protein E6J91_15115 [Deltaproteobacteria bacterium]